MNIHNLIAGLICLALVGCVSPASVSPDKVDAWMENTLPPAAKGAYRLPTPFQLGVYFEEPHDVGSGSTAEFSWSGKDRDHIFRVLKRLIKLGVLRGYVEISPTGIPVSEGLMEAAKTAGVDAILHVQGVGDVDAGRNKTARLYPLLLTTLFIPGHDVEGVFRVGLSVREVKSGRLLVSLTDSDDKESSVPMWFVDEAETLATARNRAIRRLRSPLYNQLLELAFGRETKQD